MAAKDFKEKINNLREELAEKDKEIQELEVMHKISKQAAGSVSLKETLQLIIDEACNSFDAEMGSIMFLNPQTRELTIEAAKGMEKDIIENTRIKVGERISGLVAELKEPILIKDVEKDYRFSKRSSEKYYNKSLISAPISFNHDFFGVININNKRDKGVFTEHNLDLLVAVASQAGIIINNASNYKKLQALYMETISALTEAIDTRDHYTKNHSEHVTKYVEGIARELDIDKEGLSVLRDAAKLHDIGKIGVHDYILMKPSKLNPQECEEIKLHSLKGVKILQPLTFLNSSIEIIRSHHERYDGKGYPDGKKGKDIPLGSRIMAVADSFDAMTTERPYRKALSVEEAKKELVDNKNIQFDLDVVDAFLRYLEKEKF